MEFHEVVHSWPEIKKYIKTHFREGAKIAALLNGCSLVDLHENNQLGLQPNSQFHYQTLRKFNLSSLFTAALAEVGLPPCQIQLLPPPDKSLSMPAHPSSSNTERLSPRVIEEISALLKQLNF